MPAMLAAHPPAERARGRARAASLDGELNKILNWMDLLNGADTDGVAPMTAVKPMPLRQRADAVTEGGIAEDLVANAPEAAGAFFTVPKVIE